MRSAAGHQATEGCNPPPRPRRLHKPVPTGHRSTTVNPASATSSTFSQHLPDATRRPALRCPASRQRGLGPLTGRIPVRTGPPIRIRISAGRNRVALLRDLLGNNAHRPISGVSTTLGDDPAARDQPQRTSLGPDTAARWPAPRCNGGPARRTPPGNNSPPGASCPARGSCRSRPRAPHRRPSPPRHIPRSGLAAHPV